MKQNESVDITDCSHRRWPINTLKHAFYAQWFQFSIARCSSSGQVPDKALTVV